MSLKLSKLHIKKDKNQNLARAEKKLNKQINKQMTTITYSNNNY